MVCGHSLGAGVAATIAVLLKLCGAIPSLKGVPVKAFCYGCPPVMDEELSRRVRSMVFACVAGDDVVAHLSCFSVKSLKESVLSVLTQRLRQGPDSRQVAAQTPATRSQRPEAAGANQTLGLALSPPYPPGGRRGEGGLRQSHRRSAQPEAAWGQSACTAVRHVAGEAVGNDHGEMHQKDDGCNDATAAGPVSTRGQLPRGCGLVAGRTRDVLKPAAGDDDLWPLVPPGSVFVLRDISDAAARNARGNETVSGGWLRCWGDRLKGAVCACFPNQGCDTKLPSERYRLDCMDDWLPWFQEIVVSERMFLDHLPSVLARRLRWLRREADLAPIAP